MKVFDNIVYLSAGFFVPLLPAYILYKFLPSKTSVRGPFKGLNINLKGAFGGYFILVLIAFSLIYVVLTASKPTYEVWRVTGNVEVVATDPKTGEETNYVVGTRIGQDPPELADTKGGFDRMIIVNPGHVESEIDFPGLEFYRSGYTNYVLDLNSAEKSTHEETKTITIDEIITLEKLPDSEESEESEWPR